VRKENRVHRRAAAAAAAALWQLQHCDNGLSRTLVEDRY
jgi:hypothetical protein